MHQNQWAMCMSYRAALVAERAGAGNMARNVPKADLGGTRCDEGGYSIVRFSAWDRVLTVEEILEHYRQTKASLLAVREMNEGHDGTST